MAVGVKTNQAHELNRGEADDPHRKTNRYLKRILYGNRKSFLDNAGQRPRFLTNEVQKNTDWMFEVVFDYEEGHYRGLPKDTEAREFVVASVEGPDEWGVRLDPFSSYRQVSKFVPTAYADGY